MRDGAIVEEVVEGKRKRKLGEFSFIIFNSLKTHFLAVEFIQTPTCSGYKL